MTLRLKSRFLMAVASVIFLAASSLGVVPLRAQTAEHQGASAESATQASDQVEKDENDAYRHSAMVQKFGHMLGMSTATAATTFELLNFAVLAVAIGGVAVKMLPKVFRDRSSGIQKALTDARSATEEASVRLHSVEDRLAKLDGQIEEMKQRAETDAKAEELRLKAAAEDEKNKILASAEQEIAAASALAHRQLQQYAAGLAIEHAAKRLVISVETDRLLVQNFAQRLGEGKGEN